jgi:hypothetical protein
VSYSWCDPHFAAFYARREEESRTERVLARLRERERRVLELGQIDWSREGWRELDVPARPQLRLL